MKHSAPAGYEAAAKPPLVQNESVVAAVCVTACADNTFIAWEGQQMVYRLSRHDPL